MPNCGVPSGVMPLMWMKLKPCDRCTVNNATSMSMPRSTEASAVKKPMMSAMPPKNSTQPPNRGTALTAHRWIRARRPSAVSAPRGTLARSPAWRAPRHVRSCQRVLLVEVAAREVPGVPPRLLLRLLRELGRVGGAGRLGRARAVRPEEALLALAVGGVARARRAEEHARADAGVGRAPRPGARPRADPGEGAERVGGVAREDLLARGLADRGARRARVRRARRGRGVEAALRAGGGGIAPRVLGEPGARGDPAHAARALAHGGRARLLGVRGDEDLGGGGLRLPRRRGAGPRPRLEDRQGARRRPRAGRDLRALREAEVGRPDRGGGGRPRLPRRERRRARL